MKIYDRPAAALLLVLALLCGCGSASQSSAAVTQAQTESAAAQTASAETAVLPAAVYESGEIQEEAVAAYQQAIARMQQLPAAEYTVHNAYTVNGEELISTDFDVRKTSGGSAGLLAGTGVMCYKGISVPSEIYYQNGTVYTSAAGRQTKQTGTMTQALSDCGLVEDYYATLRNASVTLCTMTAESDGSCLIRLAFRLEQDTANAGGLIEARLSADGLIREESFRMTAHYLSDSGSVTTNDNDVTKKLADSGDSCVPVFPDLSVYTEKS